MPDPYIEAMSQGFASEMKKIARKGGGGLLGLLGNKWVAGPVAGIAGWEYLKKMEKDRRMGREIRMRSQRGY